MRIKKEIEELEKHTGTSGSYNEGIKRLKELEAELAGVIGKKGEKHPDVVALKKEIDALKLAIEGMDKEEHVSEFEVSEPDNPSYINLRTQVSSTENEIEALIEQKKSR